MRIKTTPYPACDACTYYLCTGDSSAIESSDDMIPESDMELDDDGMPVHLSTLDTIDATLDAILRDEHSSGSYVLESACKVKTNGYSRCSFCGFDHLGDDAIQIAENTGECNV